MPLSLRRKHRTSGAATSSTSTDQGVSTSRIPTYAELLSTWVPKARERWSFRQSGALSNASLLEERESEVAKITARDPETWCHDFAQRRACVYAPESAETNLEAVNNSLFGKIGFLIGHAQSVVETYPASAYEQGTVSETNLKPDNDPNFPKLPAVEWLNDFERLWGDVAPEMEKPQSTETTIGSNKFQDWARLMQKASTLKPPMADATVSELE